MDVTFAEVKDQVNMLPISYYAKRSVPMVLDKDIPTSFYDCEKDEIHISYSAIAMGLENADGENEEYKETAIRSMVYHELSHAILTPADWASCVRNRGGAEYRDAFNIFEDERIETILKDFYMNVNFKKNVLYLNGGKITQPKDARQAFYNLCRFRVHDKKEFLDEVERIIKKYDGIIPEGYWETNAYCNEIFDLYDKVKQDFAENGSSTSKEEMEKAENEINNNDNGKGYDENDTADGEKRNGVFDKNKGEKQDDENGKGAGSGDGEDYGEEVDGENGEDGKDAEGKPKHSDHYNGEGKRHALDVFNKVVNRYRDTKMTECFAAIISTFNKKNQNGNGCHGYSGIFNPRNVTNPDYKFFDRRIESRGNNKFGKFHLNLFIDESGSFYYMEDAANTVVRSLEEVERKNPNFSFDLICDSDGFRETAKNARLVKADGGNHISYEEVNTVMQKHMKKNAYVYNIVLHDGGLDYYGRGKNPFLAWDRNNVTIIDTGDNSKWLKETKNARIVVVPYEKLVVQLGEEIGKALTVAFR